MKERMENENLKRSLALELKKHKVIGLSFGTAKNNLCGGGDATHGTTSAGTTTTTGDADAIMIAYITM